MGLFSRKKRVSGDEDFFSEVSKNNRYSDLQAALVEELNIGSEDSKITKIGFPGSRVITIISCDGEIIFARDSKKPIILSDFLYWNDFDSSVKDGFIETVDDEEFDERSISEFAKKWPSVLPVVLDTFYCMTVESLLFAYRNFSDYVSIETDIYFKNDVVEKLKNRSVSVLEINSFLDKENKKQKELNANLMLSNVPYNDVKLKFLKESFVWDGFPSLDKFILQGAEEQVTLADCYQLSSQFRWGDFLRKLNDFVQDKTVEVVVLTEDVPLPDEGVFVVDNNDNDDFFFENVDADSEIEVSDTVEKSVFLNKDRGFDVFKDEPVDVVLLEEHLKKLANLSNRRLKK